LEVASSSSPSPVSVATRVYRATIVVLVAMALLGQTVQLDSLFLDALGVAGPSRGPVHPALASVLAVDALLTLLFGTMALLLGFHPEVRRGGLSLGLTVAAWAYLLAYPGIITLLRPDPGSPFQLLFQTHFLIVEMVGLAALLRFSAQFPRPLSAAVLDSPSDLAPGMGLLQEVRIWLLRPSAPWIAAAGAAASALAVNGLLGNVPSEAALLGLVDALRFSALSVAVLNLRVGYLNASEEGREAAQWLGVGFAVLVGSLAVLMGANVLTAVTGWRVAYFNWRPLLLDAGILGFLLGVGMAGLYRGRLRSGPVGRRVVLLGSALATSLLLAAGLEALFSDALAAPVRLPRGVGTGLSAGLAVLLWSRLEPRLSAFLEDSMPVPDPDPPTAPT